MGYLSDPPRSGLLSSLVHTLETSGCGPGGQTPDVPNVREDFDLERLTPCECLFRHHGWAARRRRVWNALGRLCVGDVSRLRFACCGSACWVQHSASRGRFRLSANYCRSRWCVPCGVARARRLAAAISPRLKLGDTRFFTFTLRHTDTPLRDQVTRLLKCFNKLRREKCWKNTQRGAAAFVEVKIGRDARWHVHLHVLANGGFCPVRDLRAAWQKVTCDSFVVDVRRPRSIREVVNYVVKYVTKPLDSSVFIDPKRLDEAIASLKGRRLVNASGDFGKINAELPPDDGPDDWNSVGRLDALFDDACCGDSTAIAILRALAKWREPAHDAPATPPAVPPPRPSPGSGSPPA